MAWLYSRGIYFRVWLLNSVIYLHTKINFSVVVYQCRSNLFLQLCTFSLHRVVHLLWSGALAINLKK